MAKTATMTTGTPGIEITIEYNTSNLRITQVSWVLLAGFEAKAMIYNNANLVVNRTIAGPSTGSESVPGSVRMVEKVVEGITVLSLPSNITYTFNIESIGAG